MFIDRASNKRQSMNNLSAVIDGDAGWFDYIHRRAPLRCDTTNSWDPTAPKLISAAATRARVAAAVGS